jgi:hypothetical protein
LGRETGLLSSLLDGEIINGLLHSEPIGEPPQKQSHALTETFAGFAQMSGYLDGGEKGWRGFEAFDERMKSSRGIHATHCISAVSAMHFWPFVK